MNEFSNMQRGVIFKPFYKHWEDSLPAVITPSGDKKSRGLLGLPTGCMKALCIQHLSLGEGLGTPALDHQ